MFLGHYGVAFAAKKVAPKVSLGVLFIAAQFADILWPVFLVSHVEKYSIVPGISKVSPYDFIYYPYSHSLLMDIVWGLILGLVYYGITKNRRGAWVVALLVISHWILDLIVHIPDLPLSPFGDIKVGLGGWNSVAFTIAIEVLFFYGGLIIYLRNTRAVKPVGNWVLGVLVVLLTLLYFLSTFGKADNGPLIMLFIVFMLLQTILVLLANWSDKNRRLV
ncbi:MAG: hypothetical protein Q8918_12650 [Bacteroidota bacterium]|nr:hypothetical protein [Bacteroidota bacterium]MDP4211841.1 hypothetical protein [Bacteroidota bacterium]MDP4250951.1 hypothetical protein [Bacteroidota bacterium]